MKEVRVQIEAVVSVALDDCDGKADEEIAAIAENIVLDCLYHGATGEYKSPDNGTVFDNPQDGIYMRNCGVCALDIEEREEE